METCILDTGILNTCIIDSCIIDTCHMCIKDTCIIDIEVDKKELVTFAWGVKDEVKLPERPPTRSRDLESGDLNESFFLILDELRKFPAFCLFYLVQKEKSITWPIDWV